MTRWYGWKRVGSIMVIVLCMAVPTSFAEQTLYVNNTKVNVRSGPTTRADNVITTLPQGTPVVMLSQQGSWYKVRLPDGRQGWISSWVLTSPDETGQPASPAAPPQTAPQPGTSRSVPSADALEKMIFIPGGMAVIGSKAQVVEQLVQSGEASREMLQDELPQQTMSIRGFYLDQYEVTNAQYKKFVDETRYPPPLHWKSGSYPAGTGNEPVTFVSWDDAARYASWAGKRLPSAEEWELAARGLNGQRFPWGNDPLRNQANVENPSGGVAPVGSYPADVSPSTIYDMGGNVMEWTLTQYGNNKNFFILKGSSWKGKPYEARGANRTAGSAEYRLSDIGFRCARSGGSQ